MKNYLYILAALALVASCGEKPGDKTPEVTKPSAPTGLILHSSSESSLTFQWDNMTAATQYEWALTCESSTVDSGNTKGRNVTVDNLEKATEYVFTVLSVGSDGYKSQPSSITAKTEGDTTTPVDPTVDPPVSSIAYADYLIPQAEDQDGSALAFPGAQGGGMFTTGGRGGKVYHVTNLNDSGDGSLRWAIGQSGARTIVFDVAGLIELQSTLVIKNGDVTIAGQTAPGDGICLKNYTFRINASNVIVRYIRCRMGDEKKTEDDAMQVMDHDDDKFNNIIIDHCSVSWSTDECASFYGMKNFTFSWNIVSESLRVSVHGKGNHGYGGIWGGNNATYHHNLLAHHDSRNPRLDHDYVSTQKGPVSIINNVVYNWSGDSCYGGESSSKNGSDYRKYNFVGNYYRPGPATPSNRHRLLNPTTSCSNCGGTIIPGHFYMTGNVLHGNNGVTADNWTGTTASAEVIEQIKANEMFLYAANPTRIAIQSAQDAYNSVIAYAGASLVRDRIDKRVTNEAAIGSTTYTGSKGGTKGLIDTQTDVGGWPEYTATDEQKALVTDSDGDGMPDWFEDAAGLDKSKAADGAQKTIDTKGRYTNLEMYLHYLVREITRDQNTDGTYTIL